jgi:hypothetical protein
MDNQQTPLIAAFLIQEHIDSLRKFSSQPDHIKALEPQNTNFILGEDVVLWLQGSKQVIGIDGVVANIFAEDRGDYVRAVYAVAIPAQKEGIWMVVQGLYGHISKQGSTTPEHNYRAWPDEVLVDRRPKPKSTHLTRIK